MHPAPETMKGFRVEGEFLMGERKTSFSLEFACDNVLQAKHRALSILGSRHRAKRREVRITNIRELSPDEIADPGVAHVVKGAPSLPGAA